MTGADVRSIPALREWLGAMRVYQADAADALSGLSQEVRRNVDWVGEQLQLWKRAVRDCEEAVVQARAELRARQFPDHSGRMPDTTLQERGLRRAQAKQEFAEERVRACQSWLTRLPKIVEEVYAAKGHRLQVFLDTDVERGVADLTRRVESLERYAALVADTALPAAGGLT